MVHLITSNIYKLHTVGETFQNINKIFNWRSTHLSEGYSKDLLYTVDIIKRLERTGRTDRNIMVFAAKPIRKARAKYWILELRTIFPCGSNDRIGDEFSTDNIHANVASKFSPLPKKTSYVVIIVSKNGKLFLFFPLPSFFLL